MKRLLLLFLLIPSIVIADAVIFSGNDVKALKPNLDLFGSVKILSGSLNPSAGAGVVAPQGSIYMSKVVGLYNKTGAGNTAWTKASLLPVSLTTDVTGVLPISNGGTGNTSGTATINANMTGAITSLGNATLLGSFTSASLMGALTDETGTGANVFATSPTLVTPVLGVATGTSLALSTALGIASGGTGQATKTAAFDALSPMTTGGDIIYGGASGAGTRLPNGTVGQFLKSNGGTVAPSWAASNNTSAILAKTGSYTLNTSDQVVYWDTSTLPGTATLPTAVGNGGLTLTINIQLGVNALTINTTSAQTIAGVASGQIVIRNPGDRLQVVSDGSNWLVINKTSGVSIAPGLQGNMDTLLFTFSDATGSGNCVATPCTLTQQGSGVSSVIRTGTGLYSFNFPRSYARIICIASMYISGTGPASISGNGQCSSCNALSTGTRLTISGVLTDGTGSVVCYGTY